MSSKRWSSNPSDTSAFSISVDSVPGWSEGCADFIKIVYELGGLKDSSTIELSPTLQLPSTVELEEIASGLDFFGIDVDLNKIEVTGASASQIRASLFLSREKNVVDSFAWVTQSIKSNPKTVSAFLAVHDGDSLNYINKSFDVNAFNIGGRYACSGKGSEWTISLVYRNRFVAMLKEEGLDGVWNHQYTEISGPRGMDYPPDDLTVVHGRRWRLLVTVPNAEPPAKRSRTCSA